MRVHFIKLILQRIKRKEFKKFDIKNNLIKTLKKNQNQKITKKIFFNCFLTKFIKKTHSTKQVNICNLTARAKSFQRLYGLSRHSTKRLGNFGKLVNTSTKGW